MGSSKLQSTTASYEQWGQAIDPIDWPLPPTLHMAVPPELDVLHGANAEYKSRLAAVTGEQTCKHWNARPMHCLCSNLYKHKF